ncbi:non-ribosomal peptide synthetase [Caballeronia sp. LZ034LL]|uniref:non-ribosomal peptide synthetase n=1 Tax=Caballeronia sp. LZ034LL TaxID=3038567 RepID=UPI00285C8DE0|nr:non-ribosomal peptide synthetase [Caballeronia sp. LZ034LL]MDR5835727.1 amino acid adenylation domain-containing protein [Caballeronia sp. LZ034LL]
MTEIAREVSKEMLSISAAYAALPADKRAAFRERLKAGGFDAARLPISRFPDNERRFALSHAQERLWFLWRLEPSSAAYNVTGAVRLRGRLDEAALRRALDRVMDAHEILRQRFGETGGVPFQHTGSGEYGWEALDLAGDASLDAELARRSALPFDLESGPLLRVSLFRLAPDDQVLHFALHHIVADGLSTEVFVSELASAYGDALEGTSIANKANKASIQYGDYAQWQREWFDEDTLARQLDYWRACLGNDHPVLDLPHAHTRAGMRSGAGARLARVAPPALQKALGRVSLTADATLFMTLLAAYDLLLARYSGQTDIRVGVPVAGRDRPEVANMIGFFVNTLVVRTEFAGVATFAQLLERVRDRVLEAQAHADLPFTKLVEALQPQRSFGHTPLFQAMFNYLGTERDSLRLPGLDVATHDIATDTARFDLVLEARERAQGLEVALVYAEDLFDPALIGQMLDHYVRLLEQIAEDAARPLGAFELTRGKNVLPPKKAFEPVSVRFAQSVARVPDALAVHCEGERVTYGELDAWAADIERRLADAGLRADERVGICMTRSVAMVAALLGTLRSPGAFVPLDPAYPADRLAMMMDDAGVRVVLTDAAALAQCGALFAGRVALDVGVRPSDASSTPVFNAIAPHPEQLAYVIYTSGSTGRPKGVAISHGAFASHLDDFMAAHAISADDTVLQSSTINFDVALHELLPALLRGGKVEMRGQQAWDIDTTSRHLIDARVTFSRLPTAYWQQWLRSPPAPEALAALRQITVGGEGLPGDALAQWRSGPLGHIGLANLYGPTETTVACMFRATTASDVTQAVVSIGVPYASRTARVLDRDGNEAPVGALGELCIGGHTLARGYLDRPALTAERFVPDPSEPGARLYRTGDLCRMRADGAIDFLGRLDQQIKLRGIRIEPGEIEAALRRQPGVASAVVVLVTDSGAPHLVAYVVGKQQLDDAALRRALAQELPAAMVPSAIAVLDALPVMQNGKVDRAALPPVALVAQGERIAPRNEAERIVLALWAAVLGRDDLGVDDDFFAVGGDSILSLQLIARARAQGWLVTPRQVFEHPTVARLAAVMQPLESQAVAAEIVEPLPLTPIQSWFFERHPQGERHWNQSVLLHVRGELDTTALERALQAVVARHDALRLRFEPHPEGWLQEVSATVPADLLKQHDLRDHASDWRAALTAQAQHAQRQLDPQAGRVLQATYFRTPESGRLLLVIHHLVVDGVSWRILLRDIETAYGAARANREPVVEAATPWSAWVVTQRESITDEKLQAALPAWLDVLRDARRTLAPAQGTTATSRVLDWRLDAAATDALRRAAPRAYRLGIDELLLAALTRAMTTVFGGAGALIALEGHGRDAAARDDVDLSRTVGWFTTRYPVWLRAHSDDAATLIATKERLRTLPDGGASWGWLHAYGENTAALADLPVPGVSFNYLGQFDQNLAADGAFSFATENAGDPQPDDEALVYPLDLNGMIVDGCLSFGWRYDPAVLPQAQVEALKQAFDAEVAQLVAHCAATSPRATASDFPLAALTQDEFDALGIAPDEIEDLYPATPLQQGLVFHSLLKRDAYVNRKRLTLHGALDIDAMRAAWDAVVARHAVLRTRFTRAHGGDMLQVVQAKVQPFFAVHDWRSRDDYEAAFTDWFEHRAPELIDLDAAPLLHVALFRRPDGAHDLAWINHHALADGWSSARLLSELGHAYRAASRGEPLVLDPVVPYRAYVEWLRAQPDAHVWWRGQIARADRPALLLDSVPATRIAESENAADSAFHHRDDRLDATLGAALAQAAQVCGVTLNTLVQGAWALLLARFGNRRQVAFGVTVAGRPADLPGADAIQGLFINSLPLWVDVPSNRPLADWLRDLQAANVELRQAGHTPLPSIQQWAGQGFGVLFDSLLVFENFPVDAALNDGSLGLSVSASESFERTHYPLTLGIVPGERIALEWSWDARRLPDATLEQVRDAYVSLLRQIADAVSRDATLGLLRVPGRDLRRGAPEGTAAHAYRPFIARFEERVRAQGAALAVHCDGVSLTYRELHAWSNRIAARLDAEGVRREGRVGVLVGRSAGMIAALLGVMKAGAAYVPLDPAYPRERLRDMIDDAQLAALVTDAGTHALHAELTACPAIRIDQTDGLPELEDARDPHPEQLAYVIYTSGSTGKPKGVGISHGALSLHLDDFIAENGLSAADRALQFATINFDGAVEHVFATLAAGASLEVRGPALWSADEFTRVLRERRITVADLPTGYWKQWTQHLPQQAPAEVSGLVLRRVTVGGEALPGAAVAQWCAGPLGGLTLVNTYGPTEATVTTSGETVTAAHAESVAVPVGLPWASRHYRILDADGEPVPEGGSGELCIGGATLARGYLGRAALTAERFVPDPAGVPGARLYRTGDLCRWLPDGGVAFLGRIDEQVKLRGYRIELGEIERALSAQPGVAQAVVIVRGEQEARRLLGYVVPASNASPTDAALRDALADMLPAYMVPSAIAVLDVLPTLPNGKLDRKALPDIDARNAGHVAPADGTETLLAGIWQSVLGSTQVGAHDDFFALGGHSLLALQVAARLQRALGREVPLRLLFEHPQLRALAEALDGLSKQAREPVRRLHRREARPTHGQERLWFLWRLTPDNPAYHLSFAVRLDGALDARALHAALDAVVERHEILHSHFEERDGAPWLVVDETIGAEWSESTFPDAVDDTNPALAAWLREGADRAFDLSRGPLLRARLARLGDGSHVFALTVHHIAADGWSMNLLIDELLSVYGALRAGEKPALAPLPVQYTDYAVWQRESLDAAALGQQLDYWRAQLGGEQPVLELPADRPRPAVRSARGGEVETALDASLADAVQRYARRHDATVFMTLLAAFQALLHRYGGQREIRVGIPLGGREQVETEALIGFFVNTAVIRAEVSGAARFDALLSQVRQRLLEAHANQDVPFAQIVDMLQPVRAANQTPLFQAMFNLDVPASPFERHAGTGLRWSAVGTRRSAAQFDLSLNVSVGERTGLTFSYAADIFDPATVERIARDYVGVLESIVREDAVRLRDLPLAAQAVAQRGASHADAAFVPVHVRVAEQARRTPDAIAVRCEGATLTYVELDARAGRLAQRLLQQGVGAEARVGVCITRSPHMLVATLAVMKTGAAYVPLDPNYPVAHLAVMTDDAQLACIVTDAAGRDRLAEIAGDHALIAVERDDDAPGPVETLAPVHAGQLAYVIYTSGSTGKPKGVAVPHGALTRFLDSMQTRLCLHTDDVWLAVTTLSFDIAALELYLPLLTGATVELATRETIADGRRLAALLEASKASVMQATPMGWRVLLDGGWQGQRAAPLRALCGGEALPADLAAALHARGVSLWNLYGPTETTIWSSAAPLAAGTPVTLGAPLEHTSLMVLDADGNPVPENGVGELCIGGDNLARGYTRRAGLTAERFVPDPHGAPGARLYRTGDLCRVRRNGQLDYLGRADQQTKLRGFRIELGDTEAALRALDGVDDAVCQVQGEGTARRLVAFVTGHAEPGALRALLANRLPPQQVPAQIERLDALPLTANGKLDRKALPLLSATSKDGYRPPVTATETLLCEIWTEVLGVERVGLDDDFFVLGGHSLLAVRVASRAGEALGRKIELTLLFEHPVLADLAARLDRDAPAAGASGADTLDALQDLMDSL